MLRPYVAAAYLRSIITTSACLMVLRMRSCRFVFQGTEVGECIMRTIKTTATVTPEGVLTIYVPRDITPGTYPVALVIDEQTTSQEQRAERGWPAGFFEQTVGALADDPIERGEEGEYEVRRLCD
jgi:hypothetical protein